MSAADWIHALGDVANVVDAGGKARNLARLIAAGLPVPDGFVIDARAFTASLGDANTAPLDELGHALAEAARKIASTPLPAELSTLVRDRAASLGALAVRSSATIEDGTTGAAAGLFSSVTNVPLAQLDDAIRSVWSSALTPLVATYARRKTATPLAHRYAIPNAAEADAIGTPSDERHVPEPNAATGELHVPESNAATVSIAVIVQKFVPGSRVVVYTRPAGGPTSDEVLVQRGEDVIRHARGSTAPVVVLALRAEAAIGATSGADVELVEGEQLVVVQARPVVHPVVHTRAAMPPTLTALLVADGRRWTWDVAHNPDPLSTAQAELVEMIDSAGVTPFALRVCGGYLYSAHRDEVAGEVPAIERLEDIERGLFEILDGNLALDAALERYVRFYEIWARELSPLVAAAKTAAPSGARPSSVENVLLAAARGERSTDDVIAQLGVLAPAWDVAVPTYAERPDVITGAIERARAMVSATSSVEAPASCGTNSSTSTTAGADLAERDDYWFARAQWMARRALLARGAELGIGDDVFWLPFDVIRAGVGIDDAKRRAAGARAAAARASKWEPPLVVGGDEIVDERPALGGLGEGRAVGCVVRFASLASAIAVKPGDVIVARAITPALAVMVIGCAGLVSETGGMLDHGAAMARELGIPYVVGCKHAWRALDDGALVEIDNGVVRRR